MMRAQVEKGCLMILVTAFVIILSGCQTLGTPPVDTPGKRVIVANALAEQAAATSEQLFDAGKISKPTKDAYVARIKNFSASIDIAETMAKSNPQDANSRLVTIIAGLNALAAELDSKETP